MRRGEDSAQYLDIVHIDDDGRLVIPPEVLQRMGWAEGQRLELRVDSEGQLALRPALEH